MEYTINDQILLYLDDIGVTNRKVESILELCDNDISDIYLKKEEYREELEKILGDKYTEFAKNFNDKGLQNVINNLKKLKINAITRLNDNFPESLNNISPIPIAIYVVGNIDILKSNNKIAIVGTRKPSNYGIEVVENFVSDFTPYDIVTVSGLAYGIDSMVAETATYNNKPTIAVLANGLDKIYPPENTNLARLIVKTGGLVISEYKPGTKPMPYMFPERNRLISGLSNAVMIVEAGNKSGALITASCAIEQGKDLFIVPSNIFSKQSAGSNTLLYELPQALVINSSNIIEYFGYTCEDQEETVLDLDESEQLIYDALVSGEKNFDEIVLNANMESKKVNILLTTMEIRGIIKKSGSNYWSI